MPITLSKDEQKALNEFHQRLKTQFGNRLASCRLFGSKVRGDDWKESDIDVLILIENLSYADKRWVIDCSEEMNIEYLVDISPLVMSPDKLEELDKRERRLAREIREEGVLL